MISSAGEERVTLDLDQAEEAIRQRWFVWTAAGLTVHPVTRADQDDGCAGPVERSDVTAPGSISLHVSRPTAHVDVVVQRDGWAEVAVLRPGADDVMRASAQLGSVAAFGELVDRAVELITWSGEPKEPPRQHPKRAARWVLGYDGEAWSSGS